MFLKYFCEGVIDLTACEPQRFNEWAAQGLKTAREWVARRISAWHLYVFRPCLSHCCILELAFLALGSYDVSTVRDTTREVLFFDIEQIQNILLLLLLGCVQIYVRNGSSVVPRREPYFPQIRDTVVYCKLGMYCYIVNNKMNIV